ncbi:GNAT family N-acetyltransferase [Kribbella qitaiheensis]|uniref:GNAT family N-acetyltransferase n=1 Tax=Kribbella qitaiheensis TaxID=1544730 RepID=A0A7G6WUD3_9ACTN|nr:GNAT family N-acetyltransferase [Kribbella qitaiheensis]QNE17598.1 GNAT family N-acetyltransferase [Kribbella qitaiheensis]
MRFRAAGVEDAHQVALLHADSWRRHYRGAYADSFLDGDVVTERDAVWAGRLAASGGSATVLAEEGGELLGFVHVDFDRDPGWGSLVDNLHVHHGRQGGGIGRELMVRAARAVVDEAGSDAMYLWVLEQNVAAQGFYQAIGGVNVEKAAVPPPSGDPTRLNGTPSCLRMVWPDASRLMSDR